MKKMITLLFFCFLFFGFQDSYGQTNWLKSESNPILTPGTDWLSGGFPFVFLMEDGDSLRMWFTGATGVTVSTDRIGYATSSDGIHFTIRPNPIFEPSSGTGFDSEGVFGASVLFDGTTYRMWYNGYNTQPYYMGKMETGLATSPDGLTWTRYSTNPVLGKGTPGSWDDMWAYCSTVLFEDGLFKMWYTGFDGSSTNLGYATSPDGFTWTKYAYNPIFQPVNYGLKDAQNPRVIHQGNLYEMWFNSTSLNTGTIEIYYQTSPDGITWNNPPSLVMTTGSAGSFDQSWVWHPSVLVNNGAYRMWYTGYNGLEYSVGFASDSTHVGFDQTPGKEHDQRLIITPNPTSSVTQFTFSLLTPGKVDFSIHNAQGGVMYTHQPTIATSGVQKVSVDVSTFPAGIYSCIIQTPSNRFAAKMVVVH